MQNSRVRLVFVFNHKYDRNIPKLEAIYGGRFSDIRYLVPFYRGDHPDVIPIFESSAQFQGYFAQAARSIIEPGISHYIFCADDLLLNPALDENNVIERFGLTEGAAYIDYLMALSDVPFEWPHLLPALDVWRYENCVMWKAEIPSAEEARARIARHGIHLGNFGWKNLFGWNGRYNRGRGYLRHLKYLVRRKGNVPPPYPMLQSYADLIIVPGESIEEFCRLCGVFATMRLWVEIAAPTALALTCDTIITRIQHRPVDVIEQTGHRGLAIWAPERVMEIAERANHQVDRVFPVIGENYLYLHPVKLSRWNIAAPVTHAAPAVAPEPAIAR
ncbi:MAG TPA: hypothetical protein VGI81_10945 [Tepidisphaeraceae bacterium]|jgi:hypothetical protein